MATSNKTPSGLPVSKKKVQVKRARRRPYDALNAQTTTDDEKSRVETCSPSADAATAHSGHEQSDRPTPLDDRREAAEKLIRTYVIMAMGIGTIPAPVVDMAAVAVLQSRMIRKLAALYKVPYRPGPAWSLTAITGMLSLPGGLLSSITKAIPGLGVWFGMTSMPIITGAGTYAVGAVFAQHFRTGGTFVTLDPVQARRRFHQTLAEGKKVAEAA